MKITLFISFLCFASLSAIGQRIPNGKYIGYEQNPFCYSGDCKIVHDTLGEELKSKLYFKVTLIINDSVASLEKIPIRFYGSDTLPICDSTWGGYFLYRVDAITENRIIGLLTKCRYCKPCGGFCRYNYVSYQYRKYGRNYLFNGISEFNILFEKQL